ncbi:unnamed protein product [Penicillium salamii]|uniref:Uncharacterized protein n=1 Tax=Penicillium salamii TaxID=1612424 RepID=A0A9W4NYR5_9EURO|nr:unnamed protein product [Penicillium salamii]
MKPSNLGFLRIYVYTVHDCRGDRKNSFVSETELFRTGAGPFDQRAPNEYTIRRYWDDSDIFTITGHKYGDTPAREFRDASGLPMFQSRATSLAWKRPLRVRLPGNEETELVDFRIVANGKSYNRIDIEVRDMDTAAWSGCSATVRGQKVLDVRESISMNKTLPKGRAKGDISLMPRQILEISVAEGFDMSLAALIAVQMADTRFSTAPPPRR